MTNSTTVARTLCGALAALLLVMPEPAWPLAGAPDPTFDGDGSVTELIPVTDEFVNWIAVQGDDKILFTTGSDLRRLATDGSLDPTFDGDGIVALPPALVGGRIFLVGGYIYVANSAIGRYDASGTLDASYGTAGLVTLMGYLSLPIVDITIDSLGRLVGVGTSYDSMLDDTFLHVYRFGLNGFPDPTFGAGGVVTTTLTGDKAFDFAFKVVVQPDDKVVMLAGSTWDEGGAIDPEDQEEVENGGDDLEEGGDFVKGGSSLALVRYDTDGTLDTSFSGNGKAIFAAQDAYATGMALFRRTDGKFVVAAQVLENVPGDHDLIVINLARFNSDGTADTSFDGDGIVRSEVPYQASIETALLQPDGKILVDVEVRGEPYSCNPDAFVYRPGLLRFDTDGTVDQGFGNDGIATIAPSYFSSAYTFGVDSLGRVVAAGQTLPDPCIPPGQRDWLISRLLPDCTIDGVVTVGESCDDGDFDDTNGCDNRCEVRQCWSCTGTAPSVCTSEASGTPCDDENVCTANDQCDGSGQCVVATPTPVTSCIVAEQSSLTIGRGTVPAKDKIAWTWKDVKTNSYSFANPSVAGTGYTLCIFDGAGALMQVEIPPGGFCNNDRCWKTNVYTDYFKFKDKSLAHGGVEQLNLDEDGAFKLKGKGVNLPDSPVLVDPVTVQLIQHGGPNEYCYESVYTGDDFAKSNSKGFKGKHKE